METIETAVDYIMKEKTLVIEKEGEVDYLTLNRPNELNTLDDALMLELREYFGNLYFDHSVRIVVLRGAGKAFCAGLDLKSVRADKDPGEALKTQRKISEIILRMRRCPQPIISVIQGAACGGGFALALASDIRIASDRAKMNAAFIKIGLSGCDVGVSYLLPRLVGTSVASELILTGRFINADRALKTGLVSNVVPAEQLPYEVKLLVGDMLASSPLGLRLTKECLNVNVDANSLEGAIAMEDRNQVLCTQSGEFALSVNSFLG